MPPVGELAAFSTDESGQTVLAIAGHLDAQITSRIWTDAMRLASGVGPLAEDAPEASLAAWERTLERIPAELEADLYAALVALE